MQKLIFIFFISMLLSACQEPLTMPYLLRHPHVIKEQVVRCNNQTTKTQQQAQQCEVVYQAATTFMQLLQEQQRDPENFGQKIMEKELTFVNAKLAMQTAQANVQRLTSAGSNNPELKKAQSELENAHIEFKKQDDELHTLLAVVGINSPE